MQILFVPNREPGAYADAAGNGEYPEAPDKCPHKGCGMPVRMKKHGFYRRYVLTGTFVGRIKVRRYKCPACGRTVSMLPAFCTPRFQYGVQDIVSVLYDTLVRGISASRAAESNGSQPLLSRRHIIYYRRRFEKNKALVRYGLKQMSPDPTDKSRPGDCEGTKGILLEIGRRHAIAFNAEFHKETGLSFLSLHNIIA
jgi:hypothetical protein